jgi:hypothetical protein
MAIVEDLYKKLSEGGYYTKSLGEFEAQLEDPMYRKKVHGVVTRDGMEDTDFETFDIKYTPLKKKEDSASPLMEVETSGSLATPEMGTQEPLVSSSLQRDVTTTTTNQGGLTYVQGDTGIFTKPQYVQTDSKGNITGKSYIDAIINQSSMKKLLGIKSDPNLKYLAEKTPKMLEEVTITPSEESYALKKRKKSFSKILSDFVQKGQKATINIFQDIISPNVEEEKQKRLEEEKRINEKAQKLFDKEFRVLDLNDPEDFKKYQIQKAESDFKDAAVKAAGTAVGVGSDELVDILNTTFSDDFGFQYNSGLMGAVTVTLPNGTERVFDANGSDVEKKLIQAFVDSVLENQDYYKTLNKLSKTSYVNNQIEYNDLQKKLAEEEYKLKQWVTPRSGEYAAAVFGKSLSTESLQQKREYNAQKVMSKSIYLENDIAKLKEQEAALLESYSNGVIDYNTYNNMLNSGEIATTRENIVKQSEELESFEKEATEEDQFLQDMHTTATIVEQERGNATSYIGANFLKGFTDIFGGLYYLDQAAKGKGRYVDDVSISDIAEQFGGVVTEEYVQNPNMPMWQQAIGGIAGYAPGMLFDLLTTGGAATVAKATVGSVAKSAFTNAAMNIAKKALLSPSDIGMGLISFKQFEDQLNSDPITRNIPEEDKILMGLLLSYTTSKLEKVGMSSWLPKNLKSGYASSILRSAFTSIPKNASKEVVEAAIDRNISTMLAKGLLNVTKAGGTEYGTEALQTGAEETIGQVYDALKGTDYFEDKTIWEVASNMDHAGRVGLVGGAIMGGITNSFNTVRSVRNNLQTKQIINVLEDPDLKEIYKTYLTNQYKSGSMSKEEVAFLTAQLKIAEDHFSSIPDNIEDKTTAFNLITERDEINRSIAGKDEALITGQKERIEQINDELKTISKNAIKESTKQQQEGTAEGGVVQREGVDQGQPEVGQGEGTVGQATQQETNISDSTVAGGGIQETEIVAEQPVEEEVVIDKPTIATNSSQELERVKAVTPEAEDGATFNLDGTVYDGVGLVVPVVSINTTVEEATPEMIADFVEQHADKIGDKETVKMGIYKFPNSNEMSIDLNVVAPESSREQAIEFGRLADQESLFDLGSFQNVKTGGTGKNPMQFSGTQFKEIAKALKEGRLPNVFEQAPSSQSSMGTVISGTDVEIETRAAQIAKPRMTKIVSNAAKAVSRILPNTKFIVHDTQDSFAAISGDTESGGYFDPATGEIHINLEQANARTVAHEVFHAVLLNAVKTDANAAATTRRMIEAVSKNIDSNPQLKQYLDDFASNYEENIQNEEKVSELVGVLAEQYESSPESIKDVIKRWLDRIAKAFGLNPFNRNEVYDVLNTIARKTAKGKTIKASDINMMSIEGVTTTIKESKGRKQKVKVSDDQKLTFVTKEDLIDIDSLITEIANNNQKVWFWVADQLGRGNYYDAVINGEHFLDAGPSFALDPVNRDRNVIWASGANKKTLQNNINNSDYIFIISGSPQKSKLFNKTVTNLVRRRIESVGKFDKFKNELLESNPTSKLKNIINKYESYEDLFMGPDRKDFILAINEQQPKNTNAKKVLEKYNAFVDLNNLRDGFYESNKFNMGDVMIVLKADGLGEKSNHSTYETDILGSVIGVPDKIVNSYDIMPDEIKNKYRDNLSESEKIQIVAPYGIGVKDVSPRRQKVLKDKGLSDKSINTIESNYQDKFGFNDFDWNKESERDKFKEWLYNFEDKQFNKNLDKVTKLVKEDIDLLTERKIIEKKLKAFEELIIPSLGDDVLTKPLSLFEQMILMSPSATIESIEKEFKKAKTIFDEEGNIDNRKITKSQIFKGDEISLPAFERFIEKNPEYKGVFNDWKKIFDKYIELTLKDTNAFRSVSLESLNNLYDELTKLKSEGPAPRRQKALQKEVADKLTEDGKGNYIFHHYSNQKRETIKPRSGDNMITGRDEAAALSSVGGVAQFYTQEGQKEAGVGPVLHTVVVPKDKVYYLQEDQENFYDEARRQFLEVRPGQAFSPNYQAAWISKVAADNGYDMLVSKWKGDQLRAQTVKELTPIEENIPFKEQEADIYKVGDEVIVYGSKATITAMDGTVATFKGEGIAGSIDTKRNATSITKVRRQKSLKENKALNIIEKNDKYIQERTKRTKLKDVWRGYVQKFEDRQSDIKRSISGINSVYAKRAYNLLVTKAGASGWANERFKEADEKIYKGLNNEDLKNLNAIIYAMRIVAINENRAKREMEPYRGMDGFSTQDAQESLDNFKEALGDKKYADLENRAKEYFKVFNENLKLSYESGRITKETYEMLRDIDYSPIRTLKYIIGEEERTTEEIDRLSSIIGLTSDQISKLGDVNENEFVSDTRYLLMAALNASSKKGFENKLLNSFFDAFENATESEKELLIEEFYEPNPIVGTRKDGSLIHKYDKEKTPYGYKEVVFYKDGVKRKMIIKEKYANQLLDLMKVGEGWKKLGKLTLGDFLRFFATSGNPLFIIGNVARDFKNILFFSDVYGKMPLVGKAIGGPRLAFDFVKNFLRSTTGAKFKEIKREYLEHGGAMDYMAADGIRNMQSKLNKYKVLGIPQKSMVAYGKAMSFLGEKSEEAFRISVYEKTKNDLIKKYKKDNNGLEPKGQDLEDILYESVREAREVVDFNQGGQWAKNADAVSPYFNARLQGFRRAREYMVKNPLGFANNMIQYGTMAAGIAYYSISALMQATCADAEDEDDCNKKMMDAINSISEYEKASYHIIFTGNKDENGEYEYIRIPKLPVLSVMGTYAEQLATKFFFGSRGVDYDVNGDVMWNTIKSSLPFDLSSLGSNPVVGAVSAYFFNYDLFKGEEIFKAPRGWEDRVIKESVKGINDDNVNNLFKDISKTFADSGYEISPINLQAAFEKIITSESTNPTISILYAVANGIFSGGKGDMSLEELKETFSLATDELLKNTSRKLVRTTNKKLLDYEEQDKIAEMEIEENSDEYVNTTKMYDDIRDIYDSDKTLTNGQLVDMIMKTFEPATKTELRSYFNKYNNYIRNRGLDKRLLNIVFENKPKLQALYLYERYGTSLEKEEIDELNTIIKQTNSRISQTALIYYNKNYYKKK